MCSGPCTHSTHRQVQLTGRLSKTGHTKLQLFLDFWLEFVTGLLLGGHMDPILLEFDVGQILVWEPPEIGAPGTPGVSHGTKFLGPKIWPHGTPLGSLGLLSQEAPILGFDQHQILVIWGPYEPPVVVALETFAENPKTAGSRCDC